MHCRFPDGYVFKLDKEELSRSQIVTFKNGRGSNVKYLPNVFTEKGLYMLATVLKGERAAQATLAIIETYAQVRSMVREMEALQSLEDGSPEQAANLTRAGHKLAALIGDNLSTESTKTTMYGVTLVCGILILLYTRVTPHQGYAALGVRALGFA